jgi:hypothetical protein
MSRKRADDAQMRKALAQLKPPSATAVLDDDMLKTMNKLKVALGKHDASEIQRLMAEYVSKATPVKHTLQRAHPPFQFPLSLTSIINVLNTNVYLPTDNRTPLDFLVPIAHRYYEVQGGSTMGTPGTGDKTNGNMLVVQSVDLGSAEASSWVTIFVKLISFRGGPIGITTEVDWIYNDQWGVNLPWANGIAGSINFFANAWLTAYTYPLSNNPLMDLVAFQRYQLWQSNNPVNSLATSSQSGTQDAFLGFQAIPGQEYLGGVTIEVIESNTVPNNSPPPPAGTFTTHAALNATVPSIWVTGAN